MDDSLYKFCASISHLPEILSGSLKFTPPSELNDPSEMMPRFDYDEVRASLIDLRNRGHTALELEELHKQAALMECLCPELQALPAPNSQKEADAFVALSIFDDMNLVYSMFSEMTKRISERVGMCCLTKKRSSLPMWAHYADRAKGYIVQYNGLQDIFRSDSTGILNCVTKVTYSKEVSGISFYPNSYDRIFFTKFSDWEYEQEFRLVCRLCDCEQFLNNNSI